MSQSNVGGCIREQDRVVWVGDPREMPPGSSGKARRVSATRVEVDWGSGHKDVYERGGEVVSCEEAGRLGVEPWVELYESLRDLPPEERSCYPCQVHQ